MVIDLSFAFLMVATIIMSDSKWATSARNMAGDILERTSWSGRLGWRPYTQHCDNYSGSILMIDHECFKREAYVTTSLSLNMDYFTPSSGSFSFLAWFWCWLLLYRHCPKRLEVLQDNTRIDSYYARNLCERLDDLIRVNHNLALGLKVKMALPFVWVSW